MGRNAPSEACVRLCQDAVTMLRGPERQVFGWVMCGAKKLDFNQVNRMEKKDFCNLRVRGQKAPSAPTIEISGQKQAGLV